MNRRMTTISEAETLEVAGQAGALNPDRLRGEPGDAGTLERLSLRTNFSWSLAGNAVYAACQWGVLVVLAKLGNPTIVGQFGLGLAVTAPVFMLLNLQLRGIQATDARGDFAFRDYLGLRVVTTALAVLSVCLIAAMSGYAAMTAMVVVAVGIGKAFDALSDVIYGLFQQRERMDYVARASMTNGILSVVAATAGVAFTGSVLGAALGWSLASALTFALICVPGAVLLCRRSQRAAGAHHDKQAPGPHYPFRRLASLVGLAWPLGLTMMLISLNANVPRYFIETHLGEASLGIFVALAYLMVAGNMTVAAAGQSASPRLAVLYAAGQRRAFLRLLARLVLVGLALGVAGVAIALIAGRDLLRWLYTAQYADHADLLIWLAATAGVEFISSFFGHAMTAARRFRVQVPLFALATTMTLIASALLIPGRGLSGAVIALLLGALVKLAGGALIIGTTLRGQAVPVR